MPVALRDVVQEPIATKSAIRLALQSSEGLNTVWAVVEAEDDVRVYRQFLDEEVVNIKPSTDESGKKSYKNVEDIVTSIVSEVSGSRIFGIRDKDYSIYEVANYVPLPNVFLTDRRDLEMMLLESESVQSAMEEWVVNFRNRLSVAIDVAKWMGYLRICNSVNDFGYTFKNRFKASVVWDQNSHSLMKDWKERCSALLKDYISSDDINCFIEERSLEQEHAYDICRGHDVVKLLSWLLVKTEFSTDEIARKMASSYSLADFVQTSLYSSIQEWQTSKDISFLKAL